MAILDIETDDGFECTIDSDALNSNQALRLFSTASKAAKGSEKAKAASVAAMFELEELLLGDQVESLEAFVQEKTGTKYASVPDVVNAFSEIITKAREQSNDVKKS